jgi:DNA-binding transcriptional regulator YiaG
MTTNLNNIIANLSPEQQTRVAQRAKTLIAEEYTLQKLRKSLSKTQIDVATFMGVQQFQISKWERQEDLPVSKVRELVEALGGNLKLIAEFPDQSPKEIDGLGDVR